MSAVMVETAELQRESASTLTVAKEFRVTTTAQYEEAGVKLKGIMALKKKVAETFDPHIKRAFDAHRSLVAEKKTHEAPLEEAERMLKKHMLAFQLAEEAKRREAEAKAQEEARKAQEKLEARAAKAAEKGQVEKAAALQATAAAVVSPIIPTTTPKLAGVSTRVTWRAEVTNLMELVKAVAAGSVPLNALQADTAFLNNQARAMKDTLAYPGVKAVQDVGIAARS